MPRSLTRYLQLSSFLLPAVFFFSCHYASYKTLEGAAPSALSQSKLLPVIPANGSAQKYKAAIDVLNKHFTGLIIVKQTDSLSKHLVFVTELGMKMFDFEMRDTSMTPVYIFEPLNKPKLIRVLKQDFRTILLLGAYGRPALDAEWQIPGKKEKSYRIKAGKNSTFYTYRNNNQLFLQETFRKRKRQTRTSYLFNEATQAYSYIKFKQYGIVKINIELIEIPKSND